MNPLFGILLFIFACCFYISAAPADSIRRVTFAVDGLNLKATADPDAEMRLRFDIKRSTSMNEIKEAIAAKEETVFADDLYEWFLEQEDSTKQYIYSHEKGMVHLLFSESIRLKDVFLNIQVRPVQEEVYQYYDINEKEYPAAEYLLVRDPNENGQLALEFAARYGLFNLARVLLKDQRVNAAFKDKEPVRIAAKHQHFELVSFLLKTIPDTLINSQEWVQQECENGNSILLQVLLSDGRIKPTPNCLPVLKKAYSEGNQHLINLLCSDKNFDDYYRLNIAIIEAAKSNDLKVVQSLIGSSKFDKVFWGSEALNIAAKNGFFLIVDELSKHLINDIYFDTALAWAASNGHRSCVNILIRGRIHRFDNAIALAAANNDHEILNILVNDPRNTFDYTSDPKVIKVLVSHAQSSLKACASSNNMKLFKFILFNNAGLFFTVLNPQRHQTLFDYINLNEKDPFSLKRICFELSLSDTTQSSFINYLYQRVVYQNDQDLTLYLMNYFK